MTETLLSEIIRVLLFISIMALIIVGARELSKKARIKREKESEERLKKK